MIIRNPCFIFFFFSFFSYTIYVRAHSNIMELRSSRFSRLWCNLMRISSKNLATAINRYHLENSKGGVIENSKRGRGKNERVKSTFAASRRCPVCVFSCQVLKRPLRKSNEEKMTPVGLLFFSYFSFFSLFEKIRHHLLSLKNWSWLIFGFSFFKKFFCKTFSLGN